MHRIPPQLSEQAISFCALPIAHFGALTWCPGKTRKTGNRNICNRVGTYLKTLEKIHRAAARAAARAILLVYRTTSSTTLYRESGLSPAELTLDFLSRRAAMRTRGLDSYCPLYIKSHKLATGPAFHFFPYTQENSILRGDWSTLYPNLEKVLHDKKTLNIDPTLLRSTE